MNSVGELVLGMKLSSYEFNKYRTKKHSKDKNKKNTTAT